jgi:hypothetical protein
MAADVESARREWQDAFRRLEDEAARDPRRGEPLRLQLELVVDELRKRVGSRFTLKELVNEYASSDRWVRSVVAERAPTPGWPRTLVVVEGAAFYVYSRGAQDYEP